MVRIPHENSTDPRKTLRKSNDFDNAQVYNRYALKLDDNKIHRVKAQSYFVRSQKYVLPIPEESNTFLFFPHCEL
jgi:hypothetical protein